MEIDRVFYPTLTLGYGARVGIWTIGCPRRCRGCSNPELQDSAPAKDIAVPSLMRIIESISEPISGITITGGEPFFQVRELSQLVIAFRQGFGDDIMLYSGYTLGELRSQGNPYIDLILNNIAILIDGPYHDELNDDLGLRGSSNQTIHILNAKFEQRRLSLEQGSRQVQNIYFENTVFSIGIPLKSFRQKIPSHLADYGVLKDN